MHIFARTLTLISHSPRSCRVRHPVPVRHRRGLQSSEESSEGIRSDSILQNATYVSECLTSEGILSGWGEREEKGSRGGNEGRHINREGARTRARERESERARWRWRGKGKGRGREEREKVNER